MNKTKKKQFKTLTKNKTAIKFLHKNEEKSTKKESRKQKSATKSIDLIQKTEKKHTQNFNNK